MRVFYEVNVGDGACHGEVFVPDNATEEEIKVAILDNLYSVSYETVREDKA